MQIQGGKKQLATKELAPTRSVAPNGRNGAAGMSSTVAGTNPACSPDEAAIAAIVEGRHGDPFAVLGMHGGGGRTPLGARLLARR